MSRTVAFATLGCRLNQVDTLELQGALEARGFRTVPVESGADVVVINTCTVTARAEFSDRQAIQRAVRRRPGSRIVVTGCWAQTAPEAVARMPGVALVAGNGAKAQLPDLVTRLLGDEPPVARILVQDPAGQPMPPPPRLPRASGRSRAFVKVQDGCQHRCAFCVVPLARGPSRSRPPEVVLEQVARLVEDGHVEVTLTGVDLGHYGADLAPRTTLAALLRRLVELRGLRWIRLSSILPAYVTPELMEVITGSPVIAPHLHVPLQSGSDRVLRRMRRPYTVAMYRELIERLAAAIPDLGLGTDLIVGFPGETEADWAETEAVVRALPFTYLHVFGYSDRPGTEASRLTGRVEPRVVTGRSRKLRALGRAKQEAFRRRLLETVQEVLVLETRDRETGGLVGLTGNYVEVVFDGPDTLMRRLARVRLTSADGGRVSGVLA